MSTSIDNDHDLSLKLRLKRVLFLLGYYSPIEVELSQYKEAQHELKRASLTDLDVLGLKYDPLFTSHSVVCDCKTGKNVSDINRLFWLRGVTDYFGASIAYYVRPRIEVVARAIAPKLGIRTIDENELQSMEKDLGASTLPLPLHDEGFYRQRELLWGISVLKGSDPTPDQLDLKRVYSYLSYEYWYVEHHRNLLMLISHFTRIAHLLTPDDPRHVLLAHIGAERFAHCLLEMGSAIYTRGLSNIPRSGRLYLFGGPMALRDREEFFALLNQATGAKVALDPPFLGEVFELMNRYVRNSLAAVEVMRYMEAVYAWCVQLGSKQLNDVFGNGLQTAAIVLSRDTAITFAKITGMREDLFSALLAL